MRSQALRIGSTPSSNCAFEKLALFFNTSKNACVETTTALALFPMLWPVLGETGSGLLWQIGRIERSEIEMLLQRGS